MKPVQYVYPRSFILALCLTLAVIWGAGCGSGNPQPAERPVADAGEKVIKISGNGITKPGRMTLSQMLVLPDARYEQRYSIINTWPTKKMWVARGVKLTAVLQAAGIKEQAQMITVKGADGYQYSFTRLQLLQTRRFYFPGLMQDDPSGAQLVEPILAYEYMENSEDLSEARADSLCLIVPQADINEQTNQCFVQEVQEITASVDDPGRWAPASVFPPAGFIAAKETVKLQHPDLGKVKMYFTVDDSLPTTDSKVYNPSTYQPELTHPIVINQDTTIKVLVRGFGKYDSDIAEFHYRIRPQ